ncbi:MAG: thiol-disulfide isomerase/thioredoxin [Chlamydiales bacterium]
MASRSSDDESELDDYQDGWAALTELMDAGSSWSGHERNCCLVNVGDGTFCDVSTFSGLDFEDDGRAAVLTDWDRDGHPDLWLRNRTGPQLRLLRNTARAGYHFVSLTLRGTTCNRDAIGARVEVKLGDKTLVRWLRAGSGYMAQSSKCFTIGLAGATQIDRLSVIWPDAERQDFTDVAVDRFYHLDQGAAALAPVESEPVTLRPGAAQAGDPGPTRVVLRTPLPIPADIMQEIFGVLEQPGPAWIQLWAQWCAPCLAEMDSFVAGWGALEATGLRIAALTIDEDEDLARARSVFDERVRSQIDDPGFVYAEASPRARAFFEIVLEHVLARADSGALPTGFLIDRFGYLEIVTVGPVDVDQLVRDAATFGAAPERVGLRALFPGRWFFGMPRNLPGLIAELGAHGLEALARFYQLPGRQQGFEPR